jgi:hypothetical protein
MVSSRKLLATCLQLFRRPNKLHSKRGACLDDTLGKRHALKIKRVEGVVGAGSKGTGVCTSPVEARSLLTTTLSTSSRLAQAQNHPIELDTFTTPPTRESEVHRLSELDT